MNNGLANVGICFQFYRVTVAIVHSPFLTIILPSVWCFRFADKLIRSLLSFHRFLFFYHRISIAMSSLFFYQFNNFFIYNHLIFNFSSSSNACARVSITEERNSSLFYQLQILLSLKFNHPINNLRELIFQRLKKILDSHSIFILWSNWIGHRIAFSLGSECENN